MSLLAGLWLALALKSNAQGPTVAPRRPPTPIAIDRLFAAYQAGDYEIVGRTLRTPDDIRTSIAGLSSVLTAWRSDWKPSRATFLLEMSIATARVLPEAIPPIGTRNFLSESALQAILSIGSDFLMKRPTALGARSREDRYESTWHLVALGLLQGRNDWQTSERYIEVVQKRYRGRNSPDLSGRMSLARAIARVQQCCATVILSQFERQAAARGGGGLQTLGLGGTSLDASGQASTVGSGAAWGIDAVRMESALDSSIHLFDEARGFPDTAPEAIVRGAFLLFHRGRLSTALDWLAAFPWNTKDSTLRYWGDLCRGRVLDRLKRFNEAEAVYRDALRAWPGAQSAGLALALDLVRLDRRSEAAELAAATASSQTNVADPWWTYDQGDSRFVTTWLEELRQANR